MKITNEMVERLLEQEGYSKYDYSVDEWQSRVVGAREALESAARLESLSKRTKTNKRLRAQRDVALKELKAAEVKLAKVQELADTLVGGAGNVLRGILDGDP